MKQIDGSPLIFFSAAAAISRQDGHMAMVEEVLGQSNVDPPLGNLPGGGDAPTDATQRACAIIGALRAGGRVTTPEDTARLVLMMQRVIAAEERRADMRLASDTAVVGIAGPEAS